MNITQKAKELIKRAENERRANICLFHHVEGDWYLYADILSRVINYGIARVEAKNDEKLSIVHEQCVMLIAVDNPQLFMEEVYYKYMEYKGETDKFEKEHEEAQSEARNKQ